MVVHLLVALVLASPVGVVMRHPWSLVALRGNVKHCVVIGSGWCPMVSAWCQGELWDYCENGRISPEIFSPK